MSRVSKDSLYALCTWFLQHAKPLPWRDVNLHKMRNPYKVWISEIMLQQTQVAAVKEHFFKWMEVYPSLKELYNASENDVVAHWQGLGYYSRVKNIIKTSHIIVDTYGGEFPKNREELEALPGIGKYTAGAILSFAYHIPASILDGNLIRIFSRLYEIDFLPADKGKKNASAFYWDIAKEFATGELSYIQNEALMELGRNVCKVKVPDCTKCPFNNVCKSLKNKSIEKFPPKKERTYTAWHGVISIIENSCGELFIDKGKYAFLKNQKTFPHFETSASLSKEIPIEVMTILEGAQIVEFHYGKEFSHSITKNKIRMRTLYIKISNKTLPAHSLFISKDNAKRLPSSLCQKALKALGM